MSEPTPVTPRRLALAYLAVLGEEGKRGPDQELVWRDIESFCHAFQLSVEMDLSRAIPETNTLVNEGRRSYWLRARGQILTALLPAPEPVKVSRVRKKVQP